MDEGRIEYPNKLILSIDFDGVIHSYTSGWKGYRIISDPPNEGAIEWLKSLISSNRFCVNIFSSRNIDFGGRMAIRDYLKEWGMSSEEVRKIYFPLTKPAAHMIIDDRAFYFKGVFPSMKEIQEFLPWRKRKEKVKNAI